MNKALTLTNWNRGGKYYRLNATSSNKWVGFQESVIGKLKKGARQIMLDFALQTRYKKGARQIMLDFALQTRYATV